MAIQFSNLASTTLASGVSDTATSLSVTSASSFPSLGGSDYFYASIGIGSGSEIVKVTAISGTTLTVTRGQDNTTAISHASGAEISLRVTAGALEDLRDGGQVYTAGSGITLSGNAFSLTDKSNYDTAYGWGDHSQEGYLTSYTDTNTTYTAGSGITLTGTTFSLTDKTNYDTAYGWGDHAQAGYLTSYTDTNTTYTAGSGLTLTGTTFSLTDKANYDTAYGWGDHSQAGYLTSYTDTNTTYTAGSGITLTGTVFSLTDKANYDTAYGWGDHGAAGYLTSHQSLSGYATETYVGTQISALVDSAPSALDTLNELAAALGDDANFSTTVTNSIATKLPLAGGTLTGNLLLGDNTKAIFGAGSDLQIYHDGSNSYIDETATGHLFIRSNGDGIYLRSSTNEEIAHFNVNGSVKAYYDNSLKLETTSTGIDVTGTVSADGLTVASTGEVVSTVSSTSTSGAREAKLRLNVASTGGDDPAGTIEFTYGTGYTVAGSIAMSHTNPNMKFFTGTTERMRIDSSGRVGIGITSPLSVASGYGALTVGGSTGGGVILSDTSSGHGQVYANSSQLTVDAFSSRNLTFQTNGSERMRIDASGKVGIGTSSIDSDALLHLKSIQPNIRFEDTDDSKSWRLEAGSVFKLQNVTTASEAFRVDQTGNLLVGKTSADNTTAGTRIHPLGYASFTIANDYPIIANRLSSDGYITVFRKNGANVGAVGTQGGDLYLGTDDANIKFFNSASIQPVNSVGGVRDNAIDLGASSARFKDLYLSGRARAAGSTGFPAFASVTDTDTGMNPDGAGNIQFTTQGSERMRIDSAGNVGIGQAPSTFSNWRILELKGGTSGAMLNFENNASTRVAALAYDGGSDLLRIQTMVAAPITFEANNAERMRVSASGELLIGKTTGAQNTAGLEISAIHGVRATVTNNIAALFNRTSSDGDIAVFRKDGTTVGSIGSLSSRMYIGSGDTGVFFDLTRNAIVPHDPSTNAARTAAIDLGRAGVVFKDLYMSGGIKGNTLTFSGNGSSEHARLDSSGNLLVGKTTTGVSGAGVVLRGGGELFVTRAGDVMNLNRLGSDGEIAAFRKDGASVGSLKADAGSLGIGSGNCGLLFYDAGDRIIPRNGTSTSDGSLDLGYNTDRFKDLYLSGTVRGGVETAVTSTSTTITSGTHLYVSAAGQTITLPASPSQGAKAHITVGNFTDTVVARNGSNIMGSASDMTLDAAYLSIQFIYVDATRGWVMA